MELGFDGVAFQVHRADFQEQMAFVRQEMGCPSPLKPPEVEAIKAKSCLRAETMPYQLDGDDLLIHTEIDINDIQLLTIQL